MKLEESEMLAALLTAHEITLWEIERKERASAAIWRLTYQQTRREFIELEKAALVEEKKNGSDV